ncbi:hypothetical protein [Atlantibacter sp. RC6]|uniref:DUF6966 domain-containing protein n=1 Tax=Atlantibacter sp. RC6 TaxID=2587036 RepID=UPI0016060A27|nr:hypothetical protein [Atlantibacter sp. RC6]MBB3322710.1 hypothetical protein [Atlantibacter sp. RC6]
MKNEIKITVINIISTLSSNDEIAWANAFEAAGTALDSHYHDSLLSLKRFYGGIGSFNDVVLHNNGIPLIAENNKLDALRHTLYEQLEKAMCEENL